MSYKAEVHNGKRASGTDIWWALGNCLNSIWPHSQQEFMWLLRKWFLGIIGKNIRVSDAWGRLGELKSSAIRNTSVLDMPSQLYRFLKVHDTTGPRIMFFGQIHYHVEGNNLIPITLKLVSLEFILLKVAVPSMCR